MENKSSLCRFTSAWHNWEADLALHNASIWKCAPLKLTCGWEKSPWWSLTNILEHVEHKCPLCLYFCTSPSVVISFSWQLLRRGTSELQNAHESESKKQQSSCSTERKKKVSRPIPCLHVTEMLRKEIRAVKLVFLQWVKEVTTDGADVVRQPTDIQYWFMTFLTGDRGTTERLQLSSGRIGPV